MISYFPEYIFVDDNSLQRQSMQNVLRSEMETGPQKTRPIQSVGFFQISMDVYICEDKLKDFNSWFRGEIKSGAEWFLMADPFDGDTKRFRFVDYDLTWRKRGDNLITKFLIEGYDV